MDDIEENQELGFVKKLTEIVNYRKDQKELIHAAIEIAGGDKLSALKYIVTSLLHNYMRGKYASRYAKFKN